jgi:hypothetical protein
VLCGAGDSRLRRRSREIMWRSRGLARALCDGARRGSGSLCPVPVHALVATYVDLSAWVPILSASTTVLNSRALRGWNHSLALRADGRVYSWGQNYGGALGDGTDTDRCAARGDRGGSPTSSPSARAAASRSRSAPTAPCSAGARTMPPAGRRLRAEPIPAPGPRIPVPADRWALDLGRQRRRCRARARMAWCTAGADSVDGRVGDGTRGPAPAPRWWSCARMARAPSGGQQLVSSHLNPSIPKG